MAVLTAAATAAVLMPLFRSRTTVTESASEVAIYRDQLEEIERDVERGVLPESEAKPARTEIARRLLQASEAEEDGAGSEPQRRRAAFIVAIIIVPLVCVAGYLALGQPGTEDRPFDARMADPDPSDVFLVQEIVATVFQNPEGFNVDGVRALVDEAIRINPGHPSLWEALALVALMQSRPDDVVMAYDRYIVIRGTQDGTAVQLGAFLAQNAFFMNAGANPPVEALADRLLLLNPSDRGAQIFKGLALTERGELEAAEELWVAMLAEEPPEGAEWADIARSQLAELRGETPPEEPAVPGAELLAPQPEAPDAAAAPGFTEAELLQINAMVDRLATRLAEEPNDAAGWAQLIRSYIVLEREEDAAAALATARDLFTGNAEALALIEEAAAPILGNTE